MSSIEHFGYSAQWAGSACHPNTEKIRRAYCVVHTGTHGKAQTQLGWTTLSDMLSCSLIKHTL